MLRAYLSSPQIFPILKTQCRIYIRENFEVLQYLCPVLFFQSSFRASILLCQQLLHFVPYLFELIIFGVKLQALDTEVWCFWVQSKCQSSFCASKISLKLALGIKDVREIPVLLPIQARICLIEFFHHTHNQATSQCMWGLLIRWSLVGDGGKILNASSSIS